MSNVNARVTEVTVDMGHPTTEIEGDDIDDNYMDSDIDDEYNSEFEYQPGHHSYQNLAISPEHVVIMFFDKDIHSGSAKTHGVSAECLERLFCMAVVVVVILISVAYSVDNIDTEAIKDAAGLIGTGATIVGFVFCILRSDPTKCYSYFCYDMYDQHVKCIIVDKKTNRLKKAPQWDLGPIPRIKKIHYFEKHDCVVALSAVLKNGHKTIQVTDLPVGSNQESKNMFAQIFSQRIKAIKIAYVQK